MQTVFTRKVLKDHSKGIGRALGHSRHSDTQAIKALRSSKGTWVLGHSMYEGT